MSFKDLEYKKKERENNIQKINIDVTNVKTKNIVLYFTCSDHIIRLRLT